MKVLPHALAPLAYILAFFNPALPPPPPQASSFIRVMDGQSIGSGTYLGAGVVLTAAHVVANGKPQIRDDKGRVYDASITFIDAEKDIAALAIKPSEGIRAAKLSCRLPDIGEELETTGNPSGVEFIRVWGRVSTRIRSNSLLPSMFAMDMTTIPGMSGGAVFDKWGRVVGTVAAVMLYKSAPAGIGYVVPTSTICPALRSAGVI